MYKERRMNLEYEMFLNGYSIKQIAELVNVSYFKVKYDINKADKEFIIPSTVEYVAAEAFKGNASLEKVLVPQSVKRFNSKAYEGCSKLAVCFGKTIFRI